MNIVKNNYKPIIAREWMIFLVSIIIGVIFSTIVYFMDKPNYTFSTGLIDLMEHLSSKWYWGKTLLSILVPYFIVQIIRSIYYSLKILLANK